MTTLAIFIAAVLICSAILSASSDICDRLLEITRILNMMQDDDRRRKQNDSTLETTTRLKVGDRCCDNATELRKKSES